MDPRALFKPGLTVPEHEIRDLHYIGEALPVPSLITSSISVEADANTGGSPVPAREDHVHAVDVEALIQFINENEEEIDLTNYYTKAEVDQLLDEVIVGGEVDLNNYYTKAEVDTFLDILAGAIDDLDIRVGDLELLALDHEDRIDLLEGHVNIWEQYWSYGTVVNPQDDVILGKYVAYQDFYIKQGMATLAIADPSINHTADITNNGTYIGSVTVFSGTTYSTSSWSPVHIMAGDVIVVTLQEADTGTGEVFVCGLRGEYIFPEDIP